MGPSQSSGLKLNKQIINSYSVDSKNNDLCLTYLSHKQTNNGYILRQMTFNDARQYSIFLDKIQSRKKLNCQHLTQLVHVQEKTEDNMCSNFYKVYSLWQYPKRFLSQEIKERSLQKKPFQTQELLSILACSITGLGTMQKQDFRHECLTTKSILTDDNGIVKIADPLSAALVTNFETIYNNRTVQNVYLSPQQCQAIQNQKPIINKNPYKNDVFTMGVILMQCALLQRQQQCYLDDNSKINWSKIQNNINRSGQKYGDLFKRILTVMLERDIRNRPDWIDLSNTVSNGPTDTYTADNNINRTSSRSFIKRTVGSSEQPQIPQPKTSVFYNSIQTNNQPNISNQNYQYQAPILTTTTNNPVYIPRQSIPISNMISSNPVSNNIPTQNTRVTNNISFKPPLISYQPPRITTNYPTTNYNSNQTQVRTTFVPNQAFTSPPTTQTTYSSVQPSYNPIQTTFAPSQPTYAPVQSTFTPAQPTFMTQKTTIGSSPATFTTSSNFASPTFNSTFMNNVPISSNNLNNTLIKVNSNSIIQPLKPTNIINFNNPSSTSFVDSNTPRSTYQPFQINNPITHNQIKSNTSNIQYQTPIALAESSRFPANDAINSPGRQQPSPISFNNYIRPAQSVNYQVAKSQTPQNKRNTIINQITPQIIVDESKLQYVQEHFKHGSRYEGYKLNGMRHGKGKFYYQDGGSYDGYWKFNKMQGYGSLYYQSNAKAYEGYWVNDQFQGRGKLYNQSPNMLNQGYDYRSFQQIDDYWQYYDGQFDMDLKHGRGILKFSNGEIFQGTFKQDMVQGEGIFTCLNGRKIHGIWTQNQLTQIIQ